MRAAMDACRPVRRRHSQAQARSGAHLGFVEVHRTGPVLARLDLPLGVVTSINGGVRFVGEVTGIASHAGTTPMDRRRDARSPSAELVLFVERRGRVPHWSARSASWNVPNGSINVVPGRCRFSPRTSAPRPTRRATPASDVRAELAAIGQRRRRR